MKIKGFLLICMLSFSFSIYAKETTNDCEEEFNKIATDKTLDTKEKKLYTWKSLKSSCSKNGVYEKNLGDIYLSYGDYKTAENILEDAINKANYDTRWIEYKLALVSLKEKKMDTLKKRASSLIKKFPDWYAGYFFSGLCALKNKDLQTAKSLFLKANGLEETAEVYSSLASVYYLEKDYAKVVTTYRRALSLNEAVSLANLPASAHLVLSLIHLNDLEAAKKFLDIQKLCVPDIENYPGYQFSLREYEKAAKQE